MEKKTSELFPKDAVFGEISGDKINSHAFLAEWLNLEDTNAKQTNNSKPQKHSNRGGDDRN